VALRSGSVLDADAVGRIIARYTEGESQQPSHGMNPATIANTVRKSCVTLRPRNGN